MEHVPLVLLPTSSESIIYGDCYSIFIWNFREEAFVIAI